MRDDLFFIPVIAEALRHPDPSAAMCDAIERIRAAGADPRFRVGYRQFLEFMGSAYESRRQQMPEEGEAQPPAEMDRPSGFVLILERNGVVVATCPFDRGSGIRTISDILPGQWRLDTDTGHVLWEGSLTPHDVLWADALPGQDLRMAADTDESARRPTREIDLIGGALVLRAYPGVEAGSLEITLKTPESRA